MATKQPPIKTAKVTSKPLTPSGTGVVNQGRLTPRNADGSQRGNGNNPTRSTRKEPAPRSSPGPKNWWDDKRHDNDHPMAVAAGLHRLADEIYRPDLGRDPDRPTGRRSSLPDQRLYEKPSKAGQSARSQADGRNSGNARTAAKPTAKSPVKSTAKKAR